VVIDGVDLTLEAGDIHAARRERRQSALMKILGAPP
jgi:hypothetical protein